MPLARSSKHIVHGIAAGLCGGIAAGWVMNRLYRRKDLSPASWHGLEPEAVELGLALARATHRRFSSADLRRVAQAIHYGTAGLMGAVYGGLAAADRRVTLAHGAGFGGAAWLAGEIVLPAAGVSPPPNRMDVSRHALALASHLLYGVVLESVRRRLVG
jgi:putative membrane protein